MGSKLKAAATSLGINLTLLAGKIAVAAWTGSIAIMAEAAHSFFDMLASLLAYLGIKIAEQPDDSTHPYGHEKFETLSSLLQALLITGTAVIVLWESYQKFLHPAPLEHLGWGIALIAITIPIAYLTARYLSATAKKEGGSHALEADSAHFTTDVLGSVAVLAGLLLVRWGMWWGDSLAAFAVGMIMLYISIRLLRGAFYVLLDFSPGREKMRRIEGVLRKAVKSRKITRFHKLRARMAGSRILLEFHIHVPRRMSVVTAHQISSDIKRDIRKRVPQVKDATIHIEPDS